MIFLVILSGEMIFLFHENIILFFRRKMKDDLSQKSSWKYDIFFKCPKKLAFPKKIEPEHDLFCIIWKYGILFPENTMLFSWMENER